MARPKKVNDASSPELEVLVEEVIADVPAETETPVEPVVSKEQPVKKHKHVTHKRKLIIT